MYYRVGYGVNHFKYARFCSRRGSGRESRPCDGVMCYLFQTCRTEKISEIGFDGLFVIDGSIQSSVRSNDRVAGVFCCALPCGKIELE